MSGRIVELVKPQEYFREKVTHAASHLKVQLDHQLEFYLVTLLCDFIDHERLKEQDNGIDLLNTPLAMMLKTALESTPGTQVRIFKRLGDTSLYFAGFFQGFFNRKIFDIDYYITMGSTAYNSISTIMRDRHGDDHFTSMYQNLASDFQNLVEVLAAIAEDHPGLRNDKNLLAIYDQWTKTQSGRLRRILEEQGIQPFPLKSKQAQ